jgi:hypothetical protein
MLDRELIQVCPGALLLMLKSRSVRQEFQQLLRKGTRISRRDQIPGRAIENASIGFCTNLATLRDRERVNDAFFSTILLRLDDKLIVMQRLHEDEWSAACTAVQAALLESGQAYLPTAASWLERLRN